VTQHRFAVGTSIVKVNLVPRTGAGRAGYRGIVVDRVGATAAEHEGPDGISVTVRGDSSDDRLSVRMAVPDLVAAGAWFRDVLGWDVIASDRVRVGATDVLLEVEPGLAASPFDGLGGWTYLTVQVHDCVAEVAAVLARGATLVAPVRDLGDVARFALVADPFGNQLEISQRASLTGPLGPMPADGP
jgi:predicted enzyme related to lactoylglutathione lyase